MAQAKQPSEGLGEATLQPYVFSISIISAEGLSKVDSYYVTVSIEGDDQVSKQVTPINEEGVNNPKWNHEMTFMVKQVLVQQNLLSLVLKVHDKGSFFDKCVGEVRILMKEMIGENKPVDAVTFQLKKSKYHLRKPKGEIKFSYQIKEFPVCQVTAKSDELVIASPDVESGSVSAKPDELVTSSLDEDPIDSGSSYFLPEAPVPVATAAAYTPQAAAPVSVAAAAAAYTSQAAAPVPVPVAIATAYTPQAAAPVSGATYTPQALAAPVGGAAAATGYNSPYPQPMHLQGGPPFFPGYPPPVPAGYPPYQQGYGYLPPYQVYGGLQPGYGYYPAIQEPPKRNKFGVCKTLLMAASFLGLSGSSSDEILDIGPSDLWSAFVN